MAFEGFKYAEFIDRMPRRESLSSYGYAFEQIAEF